MAASVSEFIQDFIKTQEGLIRDYPSTDSLSEVSNEPVCTIMHRELGFGETQDPKAEETARLLSEQEGREVDPGIIDLTTEHHELHTFLRQLQMEALLNGAGPDQLLATMYVVGRRQGMAEAARMLGESNGPEAV